MDPQTKSTSPFYAKASTLARTGRGLSSPLISPPILITDTPFLRPSHPIMSASRAQCYGCMKWFSACGLSLHLSKTQEKRCRDALTASRVPRVPSSIQHAAMPPPLAPNRASPVSRGSSPDAEYDYTWDGQLSDTEIAVTQGAHSFFSIKTRVRFLFSITDDTFGLEDALGLEDSLDDAPDPADVADADIYEDLMISNSAPSFPNQMTGGVALQIPDPTEQCDQYEAGDQADPLPPQTPSTLVIVQFPFGNPGWPISEMPQGSSAYESWEATSTNSPWAPFQSELDWNMARWLKMYGRSSSAVTKLLTMPGVCASQ